MGLGLDCNRDYTKQICGGVCDGDSGPKNELEAGLTGSVPANAGVPTTTANLQNQGGGFLSVGVYPENSTIEQTKEPGDVGITPRDADRW